MWTEALIWLQIVVQMVFSSQETCSSFGYSLSSFTPELRLFLRTKERQHVDVLCSNEIKLPLTKD